VLSTATLRVHRGRQPIRGAPCSRAFRRPTAWSASSPNASTPTCWLVRHACVRSRIALSASTTSTSNPQWPGYHRHQHPRRSHRNLRRSRLGAPAGRGPSSSGGRSPGARRRWKGWSPDLLLGTDVYGATLGIVGMVASGAPSPARRGVRHASSLLATPSCSARARRRPLHALERLLASADVVSLHVPLTAATRHLIGRREIGRMKRGAILVNTSRGQVLDERALIHALAAGKLSARVSTCTSTSRTFRPRCALSLTSSSPRTSRAPPPPPRTDGRARGGESGRRARRARAAESRDIAAAASHVSVSRHTYPCGHGT